MSPRFVLLCIFFAFCTVGGGSSKRWVLSLLYLRPAAVLCIGALAIASARFDIRRYRAPFLILGLLAAIMILQLLPLPPGWAGAAPGHESLGRVAALSGRSVWHPLSLTPDLTVNSLLALLPAVAVLLGFASLDDADRRRSLYILPVIVLASMVLGLCQLALGPGSPAYLYAQTSPTLPVGLFANRNHQATLLAIAFPAFVAAAVPLVRRRASGMGLAGAVGILTIVSILLALLTGSRSGLVLLGVGVLAGGALAWSAVPGGKLRLYTTGSTLALLLVGGGLSIAFGRAATLDRVAAETPIASEMRVTALPVLSRLVTTYLPFGSGFGSFDPVFRTVEPDAMLQPVYFNNAHDDYIELAITGGLPAVLLLGAAGMWFGHRGWRSFRHRADVARVDRIMAQLGAVVLLIVALASVSDYPVRTPLFTAIVAMAAAWLCGGGEPGPRRVAAN